MKSMLPVLFWSLLAIFVDMRLLEMPNMQFVEQMNRRKVKIQTKKHDPEIF